MSKPVRTRRSRFVVLALLLTVLLVTGGVGRSAARGDGDVDRSFGSGGRVTTDLGLDDVGNAVAIQADGKLVVAGFSGDGFALARYNTDGSSDASFSGDGKVTTDFGTISFGYAVTTQRDRKVVVAGFTRPDPDSDFALARYNPDGSLDTSFGGDGKVTTDFGANDKAFGVAVQRDGKTVALGWAGRGSTASNVLVRYNADGSLDRSFGGDGRITSPFFGRSALAIQRNGKIIVAAGGALVRYNADGSLDTSFGGDGKVMIDFPGDDAGIFALAIQKDGKTCRGRNNDLVRWRHAL